MVLTRDTRTTSPLTATPRRPPTAGDPRLSRHRILLIGAPASGRHWLAERIHALTGIPVIGPADGVDAAEWVVIADDSEAVADVAPLADLIVLMRAPRLLRASRVVFEGLRPRGRMRGRLGETLERTSRWERAEWPAMAAVLRGAGRDWRTCASSEDVRAVLEAVFGIDTGQPRP